jgi:hypothetical protein
MAFDPDKYLEKNKSGFDPDAYLAKKSESVKPEASLGRMAQTALESYGNTATLGYLPHAQAAVERLLPDPRKGVDEELLKKGFSITTPQEGYIQSRDSNIKRQQALRAENPKSAFAGDVAGIIGGTLVTGAAGKVIGAGSNASGFLGRLKDAGKAGATIGAIANPGDVEGEYSPAQLLDRAANAGKGAAFGVIAQAGSEGVAKAGKGLADYFKGKAGEKAAGAIGANKSDMKRLGKQGAEKLGKDALEEGLVGPFSTPSSIAKNAESKLDDVGERIGGLIETADKAGTITINSQRIANQIYYDPEVATLIKTPGSTAAFSAAGEAVETLAKNGELGIREAHQLRRRIDKNINFNRKRTDLKPGEQEVLYKIRDKLNDAMNDAVNTVQGSAGNALKKANAEYSRLSKINEVAENRIAMDSSNRTFGLTDTIAAAAGAASGDTPEEKLAMSIAFGGLNKFGRTFGKGIQASGFNAASGLAAKLPGAASSVAANPAAASGAMASAKQAISGIKFDPQNFQEILGNPQLMENFEKNPDSINAVADPMLRSAIRKSLKTVRKPSGASKSAFERRLKSR